MLFADHKIQAEMDGHPKRSETNIEKKIARWAEMDMEKKIARQFKMYCYFNFKNKKPVLNKWNIHSLSKKEKNGQKIK